jgi:hypothetical protein
MKFKVRSLSSRLYVILFTSLASAYVDEFEDKSLLLVVTEYTKIESKNIEDYREFVWTSGESS